MQILPTYHLPTELIFVRFNHNNWRYIYSIGGNLQLFSKYQISKHEDWIALNRAKRITNRGYDEIIKSAYKTRM